MHPATKYWKFVPAFALSLFLLPSLTQAQHYSHKNLVSDISQPTNADGTAVLVDPNLKNPWGLTRSSGSPWWIGNNNSGTSSLFTGAGSPVNIFTEAGGVAGVGVVKGECALTNTVRRRPARWAGAPSDISDGAVALASMAAPWPRRSFTSSSRRRDRLTMWSGVVGLATTMSAPALRARSVSVGRAAVRTRSGHQRLLGRGAEFRIRRSRPGTAS
jgi:hypothetical protein